MGLLVGNLMRKTKYVPVSSWSICCGPGVADLPSVYLQEFAEGVIAETDLVGAVETKSLAAVFEYDEVWGSK